MKVLFSWIAMKEDLVKSGRTGMISGPTLQLLFDKNFNALHLFSSDKKSMEKASKLKSYVEDNKKNKLEFKKNKEIKINLELLPLNSPADYQNLWEKLPKKVESIIKGYNDPGIEVYFNLSSGTRAMTATWLMMAGTGQFRDHHPKLLSPQLIEKTGEVSTEQIDSEIFPFIHELKDKIDSDLGLVNKFRSEEMQRIMRDLAIISRGVGIPVLLLGETGTGKTTLAKQFHKMNEKKDSPFIAVVCGNFVGADLNVVKSDLFGRVKGAYTGADSDSSGFLSEADGGTLFLDEIGDIPMEAQRLLIDALDSKNFRAMGSQNVQHSNFQLLCATNKDIDTMLQKNELSQDFYFRIRNFNYTIPPLRERPEDIPVILEELLDTRIYKKLNVDQMAKNVLIKNLKKHRLPANIRDIEFFLNQLLLKSQDPETNSLSAEEINQLFEENSEPTQDEDFTTTILKSLNQWSKTSYFESGYKWRDKVLDVALRELVRSQDYKKKNGELNIRKLVNLLGVDHKTIKSRLQNLS